MRYFVISVILTLWSTCSAYAYQFILEGEAAQKYPVIIEVDRNSNGSVTGRYAYLSTLNSQGRNNRASWLYIRPEGNSKSSYIVTDSNGNIQERWNNAMFWRAGVVNYFTVGVTNAKGKSFGITAHSQNKNTSTWKGSYDIHSDGYRDCLPTNVRLTLEPNGSNSFKGIWSMRVSQDDENRFGMLFGDVEGRVNNGSITLTIKKIQTVDGTYRNAFNNREDMFYPIITEGDVIAKITKNGTTYKFQPLDKMAQYLTDMGGMLSIVKTD